MCAAVEEKFAQCLASNDSSVRNKALKRFRKWIAARSAVKDGKLLMCFDHGSCFIHASLV